MRSLFVFPALDRDEALRRLAAAGVQTELPIAVSRPGRRELIWAEIVDEFPDSEFDPEALQRAAGFRPTWGLEIALSGHFPDRRMPELRELTLRLLSDGGCATSIEDDEFRTAAEWCDRWRSMGESMS